MKNQKISKATMARFPIYLKALRNMQLEGKANFLSSELSEVTGVLDTTIRRDFSFLTGKESLGRRGIGYDTKTVIDILNNTLGLGLDEPIVLIGVGNFGKAILKYNRWQYTVGKIVCCYDQDKEKVGESYGIKIFHIDDLEESFPQECKIAILAISDNVQPTVNRLMDLGVKGIVDLTHSHFTVNDDVVVQTVDIVSSIQEMVLKMHVKDE